MLLLFEQHVSVYPIHPPTHPPTLSTYHDDDGIWSGTA